MNFAAQLVARCFAARTAAHFAHLTTRSYSQHMALGSFYEDIVDAADEYVEVYNGLEGLITSYPNVPPMTGPAVEFIADLADWLEENRGKAAYGHRALENLIDNITAICARTVYKLENLK